tara:strand:- start:1083 stop:1241 length:159 start_codon:yes stop_codon:yes gene_type:complete
MPSMTNDRKPLLTCFSVIVSCDFSQLITLNLKNYFGKQETLSILAGIVLLIV